MRIRSKKVWIADQFVPAVIEIKENKIHRIYPYENESADQDYGSLRIIPGLIDIHCHGAFGFDTNDAHEEGLKNWAKKIPSEGVTSFLPTTITQSEEVLMNAVRNVGN
ncbi:MAG: N-acetylglucosamine-6-phosphate deacetylase, partial [Erysipelotrichaceae bacterium]|nr:N-acetylglucosamine-6-phosphate deacetylase [Erysipelotrichaceae bacterium]